MCPISFSLLSVHLDHIQVVIRALELAKGGFARQVTLHGKTLSILTCGLLSRTTLMSFLYSKPWYSVIKFP